MRCTLVLYLVVTIFVVAYSLPEICWIDGDERLRANCNKVFSDYILSFIPPIAQNISFITLTGQPIKQLPYNAFRNLSSQSTILGIWIPHCQISRVDAAALRNLHGLIDINLSHNDIKQVDSKLFSDTKQIEIIQMGNNKIEVLPRGLFENLAQLKVVYLNDNRIRLVQDNSFRNTPALEMIDLGNNRIEFMNMSFKDKFDNLSYLMLSGNPWKCDCKLGPLYELLLKFNQLDHYRLLCKKPPALQGGKWIDIGRDKFVCSSKNAIQDTVTTTTSTEPMTTTEQDDSKPVAVVNGTKYQSVGTGIPQSASNQHWIPYTISVLVLVMIVPVIIGAVFVAKRTPAIVKRRSNRRTNTPNTDSDLSMPVIQSRAVSENDDSAANTDDVMNTIPPL